MTVVTRTLQRGTDPLNGGEFYIGATWDSNMPDEDGTPTEPAASMLVTAVQYKNMSTSLKTANVGGVEIKIPINTPHTNRNLNKPQQTRLDSVGYVWLY